jgi:hypothetical protein
MRDQRDQRDQFETHHLTCLVCGALPGTACVDRRFQELPEVHESRRMPISERNWRLDQGWQPPELAEERRTREIQKIARGALFNPALGPDAQQVRQALRRRRQGNL